MGIKGFRSWLESQFPDSVVAMPKTGLSEKFDHVLIDMNQFLHVVLRKSRSDGHGLTLLMKELDECLQLATPTQSLVLAIDGPPSAAKLATQRKRRFATVVKSDYKLKQLDKLLTPKPKLLARKKRRAAAETRTLCITPATEFMFKVEQALLYWVWQRLSARNSPLSVNNVKVFISPSTVAGEGEVKLLEWIYNKPTRKGESIAILGGDSDLVLEGLVIPPASTHNVFVLLPEGNKRYLSVSLWEITRTLHRHVPHLSINNMMKVRTDLTLLLILNGNDYLPKLRGSSGFNKVFHTYLRIQRAWENKKKADDAYLVDPDSLEFNVDFCIDFFSRLAAIAPDNLWSKDRDRSVEAGDDGMGRSLHRLYNYVNAGYLPEPMVFKIVQDDERGNLSIYNETDFGGDASESSEEDVSDDEEIEEEQVLVRLTLGKPESEDYCAYELWYPKGAPLQKAKHKLAAMALSDLVGSDSEEDEDDDLLGIASTGYEWEVRVAVEGDTCDYLYGLLWNLQTYQDGICGDYGYNYGKRLSPTAKEIVEFFEESKRDGNRVGLGELSPGPFTPPVSAGLSCLAALPSAVKHLVPEPYRSIDDETVEVIYASCMDKDNNVFDVKMFEKLCEERIANSVERHAVGGIQEEEQHRGRKIIMGDHYWMVISKVPKPLTHPFDPPAPFSDRLSNLRPNNRIRVSRVMASAEPRPRSVWNGQKAPQTHKEGFTHKDTREVIHSDPGLFFRKYESIEDVEYKSCYEMMKQKKPKAHRKKTTQMTALRSKTISPKTNGIDIAKRMRAFKLEQPPTEPPTTTDGLTAMACLKQLEDAELVGPVLWTTTMPSKSEYASFDPKGHENVKLVVGKGKALKKQLKYEQDRSINFTSKQSLKQHLASCALRDIVGSSSAWCSMSFKEIKSRLTAMAG